MNELARVREMINICWICIFLWIYYGGLGDYIIKIWIRINCCLGIGNRGEEVKLLGS